MVALLNGFELDPSDKNAADIMGKMQALNAKYWATHK